MKLTLSQQISESMVVQLYHHSFIPTIMHLCAAGLLIFISWGMISVEFVLQWSSLLVVTLLVTVLNFTMFIRKRGNQHLDYTKWERSFSFISAFTSIVFSLAYIAVILSAPAALFPSIALVLVMHLSCTVIPCCTSKKAMFWFTLPLAVPIIGTLFWLTQANINNLAIALIFYSLTFLGLSLKINFILKAGFESAISNTEALGMLEIYKHKLKTSTIDDPQTRILNRRFFNLIMNEEVRRSKRSGQNLTLALIQIDCFETYQERYGQQKSNKCLRTVAKVLADATPRGGEYLTRFDNDTFALIVPNIEIEEALAFTTKMMDLVTKAQIEHQQTTVEHRQRISISVGIAEFSTTNIITLEELIKQASLALNSAITSGGNNTQVFSTKPLLASEPRRSNNAAIKNIYNTLDDAEQGEPVY
jgi:diguanylate cyclase (GGDEF)-like protein